MSARGKKLGILAVETPAVTEKTLDELVKSASESEEPPVEELPGAKGGVFTPPEPVEEPKIEKKDGNKPSKAPKTVKEEPERSVEDELKDILNVQRGKRAVPSLISFYSARSNALRYVIVDVTDSIVSDAWKKYKEMCPSPDAEEFMGLLYKILNTDVPRMYRAVAPVDLR